MILARLNGSSRSVGMEGIGVTCIIGLGVMELMRIIILQQNGIVNIAMIIVTIVSIEKVDMRGLVSENFIFMEAFFLIITLYIIVG